MLAVAAWLAVTLAPLAAAEDEAQAQHAGAATQSQDRGAGAGLLGGRTAPGSDPGPVPESAPGSEQADTPGAGTATSLRPPADGEAARSAGRPGPWDRLMIRVNEQQRALQRELATAVQQLRRGESLAPLYTLALIGFLYGVFHAIGPGHGKVVISSYLVATGSAMRRGVLLAFVASFVQALSAIALVAIMAMLLNVSSRETTARVQILEMVSYSLVIALGLWLMAGTLRAIWTGNSADCGHDHGHHGHPEFGPPPEGRGRFLALVGSIGIRPCSGAVIILLFALAQGLFWAGVGATFAMALGTAITVSLIAVLTVVSRRTALRLARGDGRWQGYLHNTLALLGSLAVVFFGAVLLSAAWTRTGPL
jgi:nickel/cobalt transporter (NicO) family protein